MFKKYYKEANDDIKTNRELIGKIFEAAENPVKPKKSAKIYKFGMAAVAVLVLGVSVTMFSWFSENDESINQSSSIAQSDNYEVPIQNDSDDLSVKPIETENDAVEKNTFDDVVLAQNDENEKSGEVDNSTGKETSKNEGKTGKISEEKVDKVPEKTEENPIGESNTKKTTSTQDEPKKVENVKPIDIEAETVPETSGGEAVLAMENGEAQGFSIHDGRTTDKPIENNEISVSADEFVEASETEAQIISEFLTGKYGTKDEETGYDYSFNVVGKAEVNGESVYYVRWSWLVDNDHMSLIQNFVINESMTELYYCVFAGDDVYWTTTDNILE